MSIKKKLGLGMASAALGLSLVGGGTFAYFTDEATIHNAFQSGTLDIDVKALYGDLGNKWPINFDLNNIRPGDKFERTFKFDNTGSLAIEDVFMDVTATVTDELGTKGDTNDFLRSLKVYYFVDKVGDPDEKAISLLDGGAVSLYDVINGNPADYFKEQFVKEGRLTLTPGGIGVDETPDRRYRIAIEFEDNGQNQNKLQGMKALVDFNLEARQEIGSKKQEMGGPNGYIEGNKEYKGKLDKVSNSNLVNPQVTDEDAWND
ncbi:TasA family protein [Fredinandcohnia onubensis]|uniref:TasA family protein n=1 Tax=Fredinandcohnia onubensis TaxID=1571209 RepID=UPI000C0BC0C0|nr:TasA family protein [Fredinandcohnia onubensis]